ncbi:MAG TPA: exosortase/archaeosortase family protein [Opitutaceae bacterium]
MAAAENKPPNASAGNQVHSPAFVGSAILLGIAGIVLFHFFGNATRGYIHSASLFYWLWAQWFDPAADASQGPLVVVVALALVMWNWFRFSTYPKNGDARGFSLIGGALALHALGYATQQTRLSVISWLIFIAGLCALIGGQRGLRAARFPLVFALLAVPVGFLQPWSFSLRLAISRSVEAIFRLAAHPIVRDGTQLFSLDGRQAYDVEAACSGVHSLVALAALAILLGYLRLTNWPRKLIILALVLPFAFLGNLIRVLAIVLAGEKFGPNAAQRVHALSGFLVFAVVFVLLWLVMRWLETRIAMNDAAIEEARAVPAAIASRTSSSSLAALWTALLLIEAILVAIDVRALERRPPVPAGVKLSADGVNPMALPDFLGTEWIGQRVDVTSVERSILPPDTGYSRKNYVSVADRSQQVFVSVVLSGQDRTSIHRPELCLVGQGWVIEKSETAELWTAPSLPITLLHLRRDAWTRSGERHVLHALFAYVFVSEDAVEGTHLGMLWNNAVHRLRHLRGERWAYVVVQTLLSDQPGAAQTESASNKGEREENAAIHRMEVVFRPVWTALRK